MSSLSTNMYHMDVNHTPAADVICNCAMRPVHAWHWRGAAEGWPLVKGQSQSRQVAAHGMIALRAFWFGLPGPHMASPPCWVCAFSVLCLCGAFVLVPAPLSLFLSLSLSPQRMLQQGVSRSLKTEGTYRDIEGDLEGDSEGDLEGGLD